MDDGADIVPAAKKAKINIKTARDIKRRADTITVYCDQHNLPPLSLHDRTIIQPKSGRRPALSELQVNQLDAAINQDRHYREMPQLEVSNELRFHVSKTVVRNECRNLNIYRVKSTKKLDLIDIQKAIQYKIALSQKD